jgi:hypothetical protein
MGVDFNKTTMDISEVTAWDEREAADARVENEKTGQTMASSSAGTDDFVDALTGQQQEQTTEVAEPEWDATIVEPGQTLRTEREGADTRRELLSTPGAQEKRKRQGSGEGETKEDRRNPIADQGATPRKKPKQAVRPTDGEKGKREETPIFNPKVPPPMSYLAAASARTAGGASTATTPAAAAAATNPPAKMDGN